MQKLNIQGGIFGQSGYASHTIQLARALDKYTDLALETNMNEDWIRQVNNQTYQWINKRYPEEATISITQPWFWPVKLSDKPKKFAGFLVWEGDKIPKGWLKKLIDTRINYIFVPSKHTKEAIEKTWNNQLEIDPTMTCLAPIKIIPHGVDLELFKPDKKKEDDVFTFLINKGWTGGWEDRGGLQYLFKAFTEEFTKEDKVRLLIKLNMTYTGYDWNWRKAINDLGIIKNENSPEMQVWSDPVPFEMLSTIYNKADCFVCPTRAEAFGLTMLEAMACGLPVITTNFGGQTDFVTEENGWLIGGELEEVKHDIQYEGIKWLTPNIEELKKAMRYAYEHQDEVKTKGLKAREKAEEFSWDNSAKKVLEAFNDNRDN